MKCVHGHQMSRTINGVYYCPDCGSTQVATDPINNPSHYCVNGMECIDVIEALGLGYRLGSAFAYIWRAGRKASAVEDLKKARWFLDREIAKLEGKP